MGKLLSTVCACESVLGFRAVLCLRLISAAPHLVPVALRLALVVSLHKRKGVRYTASPSSSGSSCGDSNGGFDSCLACCARLARQKSSSGLLELHRPGRTALSLISQLFLILSPSVDCLAAVDSYA